MANFTRDLTESVTIQDFLSGGGNFGFGPSSYSYFSSFANPTGPGSYLPTQNVDALGPRQDYLHRLSNFAPEGTDLDVIGRLFGVEGEESPVSGNFFSPEGDDESAAWGLNQTRNLIESNTFADAVSVNGDFIRSITENLSIQARVGHSKGLFLRADLSGIVTVNPEVRAMLETPGSGEIAVSQRPIVGPFKVLRYIPGTTIGTPNTADLGAVPDTVGSQGFIFDDSPQGVFLRGAWQVKVVINDTQASGSVQVAVNMFIVKATPAGVSKQYQIGTTKVSSPFTPSTTPVQLTFDWVYGEVGEIYVNSDEYFYLEAFVEEISHPVTAGLSRLRLNNLLNDLFSQVNYPGVTNESTETVFVPAETVIISDAVSFILGYNRFVTESVVVSDAVTLSFGAYRQLVESMTFVDVVQAWKNALIENITITDAVDRVVNNIRNLVETVVISDSAQVYSNSPKTLIENIVITDSVTYSITRGNEQKRGKNINKRPLDNVVRRRRNRIV